jgi:tRNA pseudouridine13 synthase
MKLKQQPDDFQVEELTDVVPQPQGAFALYRIEKRGWSTLDALAAIRRRWRVEPRRLSYGGLKDRHAWTRQYLTIFHGPSRNLTQQSVYVEYLGQVPAPYTSHDIRANRFVLTLRDFDEESLERAVHTLDELKSDGLPNYFDDQRFGSVSADGEFIAKHIILGRYEDALKQALVQPYEFDRSTHKKEKALLRARWGDWALLRDRLPDVHTRRLMAYLSHHPADFKGALERLRPELRGLYLAAYQSYLWNRMLARWLKERLPPEQLVSVRLRLGDLPMPRRLDAEQRAALAALRLPLPSGRTALEPDHPGKVLMDAVLAEEGLAEAQLKLKDFRELFFSKGDRAAHCQPETLSSESGEDERHPNRKKLILRFDLPRGSYATLIVKRITR